MIEPSLEPASNIDEKVVINAENQTSETPETIVSVEEEITQNQPGNNSFCATKFRNYFRGKND
ncbi:MAG: hypothetical protein IPO04_21405 [Cytophagaceae bacterium]|nr:hypothetical protein [Cytophagaceae bacterium]